jgi:hypothetical protein
MFDLSRLSGGFQLSATSRATPSLRIATQLAV